ncbi:ATP synthase F1, epsilon subunit [Caldicellulosiruptor kronotskyensis 2002]|uniref:ATP synthase epsilon chain n=1 Tax=Caldicellulosiruptor kronotskyensis (strain DSM 18902 / VKM B-2412 / 2002) TaxID=632348 RepID=E4SBM5_CALK2|nr:ATP synthase F1 subunit epsilon [Caldicellulosiruptor kronotskyensis]ADQ46148.1 ATP synthase F1, epsilon subunit [Caldicellulosiruptor kronotskyensis 2002]
MAEFELEVLQPERVFFKDKVEMIVLRTIDGEIGIMANHQPIVVPIGIGKLRIKKDGKWREAAIAGGLLEVKNNKATILSDAVEWPEEIDRQRALLAKERAEKRLEQKLPPDEYERYRAALYRALNRLKLAEENKKEI